MRDKPYYSVRLGTNPNTKLNLTSLLKIFKNLYLDFQNKGYLQEAFGFDCVDSGFIPGNLGMDIEGAILIDIRKENLWPIVDNSPNYTEDDLFDIIEFLHDHISKPTESWLHSFNNCGLHCSKYDQQVGRKEFRDKINKALDSYGNGYELSENGLILNKPENGLENLYKASLPSKDKNNIETRVSLAINKFRRHRSSLEDRKDAIRDLADVLEYLRPQLKQALTSKDENDLFQLANGFGIRHHNAQQKTSYDKNIWYSWIFYYYLATIHAALRLIEKSAK